MKRRRSTQATMTARQVIYSGRVQGVGFRAAMRQIAAGFEVTGWVKNRPDGSIELLADGEEESIKEIISWAHHGPSAARVDDVDVRWRGYTGEFADFRITE